MSNSSAEMQRRLRMPERLRHGLTCPICGGKKRRGGMRTAPAPLLFIILDHLAHLILYDIHFFSLAFSVNSRFPRICRWKYFLIVVSLLAWEENDDFSRVLRLLSYFLDLLFTC